MKEVEKGLEEITLKGFIRVVMYMVSLILFFGATISFVVDSAYGTTLLNTTQKDAVTQVMVVAIALRVFAPKSSR